MTRLQFAIISAVKAVLRLFSPDPPEKAPPSDPGLRQVFFYRVAPNAEEAVDRAFEKRDQ